MCIRDSLHTAPEFCLVLSSTLLYVFRDHKDYQGRGAQDGYLDLHTAPEFCLVLSSTLLYVFRDHKDYQGREAQDGYLDFHTAPELWRD